MLNANLSMHNWENLLQICSYYINILENQIDKTKSKDYSKQPHPSKDKFALMNCSDHSKFAPLNLWAIFLRLKLYPLIMRQLNCENENGTFHSKVHKQRKKI